MADISIHHVSATYREFMEMFTLLLAEANRCHADVALPDDQFARRAFVRATFAYIEGVTYALKQIALLASEGTFTLGGGGNSGGVPLYRSLPV